MRNVQDFTLGDPETATCPYDYYKAMRAQDPVHYDEKIKTFIVSRHEDIMKEATMTYISRCLIALEQR